MNIFISYAPRDEGLALDLASRLDKAGHHVWYAGGHIFPGDNPGREAGSALEQAEAMLVLVSPESMQSRDVRQEIDYALGSPRFAGRVVPIVVEPTQDAPWIFKTFPVIAGVKRPGDMTRRVLGHLKSAGR